MGQRQLVALARVLLQDPAIVIMDEATASVDPLTEAQIQEGLDIVLAGRTAIVIAHRLSTIREADRIIVLREGKIVEEGSHDMLMLAGRPLRRPLQHLLPPPVARLPARRGIRTSSRGVVAKTLEVSESVIHVAPVPDEDDDNNQHLVANVIDDAIVANANAPE